MKHFLAILIFITFNANAALTDISPLGKVNLAKSKPAAKPKTVKTPQNVQKPVAVSTNSATIDAKAIYSKSCFFCHGTGAANAPKLGDKTAWAPRIAAGTDVLLNIALKGKGAMPPKGGNMSLTEAEIKAVVEYMIENSK